MSKHLNGIIVNAVCFQIVWFICVQGNNLYAVGSLTLMLVAHYLWVQKHNTEWIVIISIGLFGIMLDSVFSSVGLFYLSSSISISLSSVDLFFAPIWLICIWFAFSTTLLHSLAWLNRKPVWAAMLGAIFGPLSYYTGVNISESAFPEPVFSPLLVLAMVWLALLPLFMSFAQKIQSSLSLQVAPILPPEQH